MNWYKPPWNVQVATNIGKLLLDMKTIIANHDINVSENEITNRSEAPLEECNLRKPNESPTNSQCQILEIVCKSKVVTRQRMCKNLFHIKAKNLGYIMVQEKKFRKAMVKIHLNY